MKLVAIVVTVILLGASGIVFWDFTASFRGELAAKLDVYAGKYEFLTYGLTPWLPEYSRLLSDRYGVRTRAVAGCVVSDSLVSYVDAYDKVSMDAANRKFGHDILEESRNEAMARFLQRIHQIVRLEQ